MVCSWLTNMSSELKKLRFITIVGAEGVESQLCDPHLVIMHKFQLCTPIAESAKQYILHILDWGPLLFPLSRRPQ